MSEELNNQLTSIQADYTQQIGSLQENVTVSFNEMNNQIETNNNNLNTKLDANNNALNQSINNQTSTLQQQISNIETNLTNSMNTNDTEILKRLDEYQKSVNDSFTSVSNGKKLLASTLLTYKIHVAEDATFKEIADAITLIGNQKVANDTVIQVMNSTDNITADKILAGQSVTKSEVTTDENGNYITNENVIYGTATSDATAIANNLSSGKTAYVNGQLITGNGKDVDDAYQLGYADGLAKQSNNTKMTFHYGHKHYGSSSKGTGCYTKYHSGNRCNAACWAVETGHFAYNNQYDQPVYAAASVCANGHSFTDYGVAVQYVGQHFNGCPVTTSPYYTVNCGIAEGTEVRTSNTLDTRDNEIIISAEIDFQ